MASPVVEPQLSEEDSNRPPLLPLSTRIKYAAIVFAIQNLLIAPSLLISDVKSYFYPPTDGPDIVKSYPARKDLPIRVFLPKSAPSAGSSALKVLPTLFTIHGGGFVMGRPQDDDAWNRAFAERHGFLVVALNYRKAPTHAFPAPQHDLAELTALCLADAALPIDRARGIAIAGFSAGGTLALGLVQLLKKSGSAVPVKAVLPMYPMLDVATVRARKEATRRRKPALGGARARDGDPTAAIAPVFDWAYVPAGTDRRDPLLSPLYGVDAGAYDGIGVFVVACELDRLANESWRMASKLAGRAVPGVDEPVGREKPAGEGELVLDDERFAFEGGRCRWLLVPDTIHGYDALKENEMPDGDLLRDAKLKADKVIDIVGKWLLAGPLSSMPSSDPS